MNNTLPDTKDRELVSKAYINITPIEFNITDSAIDNLRIEHPVKPVTNTKELKENAASIAVIRTLRVHVDKKRKELKKDALEYGRNVDTEAQRITESLVSIEQPLKDAKEAYEAKKAAIAAEKQRIEDLRIKNIRDTIEKIRLCPGQYISATVVHIKEAIESLLIAKDDFDYQEFASEALQVKTAAIIELNQLQANRDEQDKQETEAEEKRIALEKQEAELKVERGKLEQEREAIEAERAEATRLAKIKQDKLARERQEFADREAAYKADIEVKKEAERVAAIAKHLVDVSEEALKNAPQTIAGDIITCPHCDGKFQLSESEQND